ncbi:pseudouridine synthase, RluA family [Aeromicrobium marinum DSM 15272]|uniref:Pseudouridine synthase n=1 Tax=Aeromicrobium marinum DSM 15272 TaxID=585531 RepID=E2S952_9ACTN|nr:RluA family pseudouridine synthase [Aeromicrobium marinum]EFQ84322.1 pseudouridine synthase, RluA family [Aeromicrobium marinum DSM 15272]
MSGRPAGEHKVISVPEGLDGERVDVALARLTGLSRSRASELVADGHVLLDGHRPAKSERVLFGAVLEATIPAPPVVEVVPIPVDALSIVHEDDDIVVVDKPVGVAAHPGVGWTGPTVLGALAARGYRISTSGAPERQGIVHRLDVGTSGLMAVAKSEHAYTVLKQAFRDRVVDKTYHSLVQGHPDPHTGTIDAPIARHPKHDFKFTVRADGRASVTHYATLEAHRYASLLTIKLETGRTHQIRVHMAAIKHPCVGDPLYGADPTLAARVGLERQWLHALGLGFDHPRTGERVDFASTYPADLQAALDTVRDLD